MSKVKEPMIKIGGGSFATSYVLGFEKEKFIKEHIYLAEGFHSAPEDYLSDIWDLAHRSDDFKQRNANDAVEVQVTDETEPKFKTPGVKKTATKRDSEQPRK